MGEKFKSLINDDSLYFSLLLVLIAIASFGLGRASIEVEEIGVAKVEYQEAPRPLPTGVEQTTLAIEETLGFKVVASKNGTKYHLPDCSGAKNIKEENKVFFASVAMAEAAGYTPAANCPGL